MAGLAELREKTKNLTVLYVEDSPVLQKKMSVFLGKLFKTVYQASNGIEGIQSFDFDKPDIVISDIDMPEMNGHEMIEKLKEIDPYANIIMYSAYADSENLLKSIHLGVVDFIPKPVDLKLFEEVLTKVVDKFEAKKKTAAPVVEQKKEPINEKELSQKEHDEIFQHLEIIKKSQQTIEFVNHYRGVPIIEKGTIISISLDSITVEIPFFQAKAIKYEGRVVLISELFAHTIEAELDKFNGYNNTVSLKNIKYLEDKTRRRKVVCVEPNERFKSAIIFKNKLIKSVPVLVSAGFIIFHVELEDDVELVEGNGLDLKIIIARQKDKKTVTNLTLELKGELYVMKKIDNTKSKIMLLLEIKKNQKVILDDYITTRRQELIVEFKQMKD